MHLLVWPLVIVLVIGDFLSGLRGEDKEDYLMGLVGL